MHAETPAHDSKHITYISSFNFHNPLRSKDATRKAKTVQNGLHLIIPLVEGIIQDSTQVHENSSNLPSCYSKREFTTSTFVSLLKIRPLLFELL